MMKLPRRQFLHFTTGAVVLSTVSRVAWADYPSRPITIVVGYPAGGPTDALGRLLAEQMKGALGQPVVIENRPGAQGTTGAVSVVNATPDGHTLLVTPNATVTLNPHLQKNFPLRPLTALAPITVASEATIVLCVHPSVPAKNAAELVEYARKNSGKLSYGTAGIGSGHHLAGELLKQRTGIDITHIPYRGIAAEVQDLVAGHIQIGFGGSNTAPQLAAAGKVRIIAVVEAKRSAELPDIPTIAETYPGAAIPITWFGLLAPAGTPKPAIETLYKALVAALRNHDVVTKLKQLGQVAVAEGPDALVRRMQEEIAVYDRLIPSIGIQPE